MSDGKQIMWGLVFCVVAGALAYSGAAWGFGFWLGTLTR
jgi:hypothetical protein